MTRKGRLPIEIPTGVEIKIADTNVSVKGPKGQLQLQLAQGIQAKLENNQVFVVQTDAKKESNQYQGLYHALITNMVHGASKGFEKRLQMIGVGYRAAVQGTNLNLQVGLSHPTNIPIPSDIQVNVEKNTTIIVNGADKQKVGEFSAIIKAVRPPEPYQGKGIRYEGEYVRKKAGKAASKK